MLLPHWQTSPEYQSRVPDISRSTFYQVTDLLLERPNLNSSHLFRADIIFDSAAKLQTVFEKERLHVSTNTLAARPESPSGLKIKPGAEGADLCQLRSSSDTHADTQPVPSETHTDAQAVPADEICGFALMRTVVRRLIPRKPHVDRPMDQSCLVYVSKDGHGHAENSVLVVYAPHVQSEAGIPWYHPTVKRLAYQFTEHGSEKWLAVHYQLFSKSENVESNRLHRTILSLLQTFIRLSKHDAPLYEGVSHSASSVSARSINPGALKDTILPQHTVQDTYTRLKQRHASDLIAKWVEKTEPSKHVFEDLSIAAFLIELWNTMYKEDDFPGFVDIACGNGVLVYILIQEGYRGRGFDARRRKTWKILDIEGALEEKLCIPKPFYDHLSEEEIRNAVGNIAVHNGIFDPDTFIISNHADELTPWTPVLAYLSSTDHQLPFLSIPCCSHSLSGRKYRYTLKDIDASAAHSPPQPTTATATADTEPEQSATGDLKALKLQKATAAAHGDDKSTYACLTKKTEALAEELGYHAEMTLMRIPSTRNIGIVGGRRKQKQKQRLQNQSRAMNAVATLVERECRATGGVPASAGAWLERARKHVQGQGRGKVNLKCCPVPLPPPGLQD